MMLEAQVIPYADMLQETWHRLQHAADDPAHPMHLVVAATIDGNVRPAARTLVLRGASRSPPRLWFHSDARASKVEQLRLKPDICVIAYDHRDGVQLRIDGRVIVHVDDRITDAHWMQTDMAVRYAYAADAPPGTPVANAAETDPRSMTHRHRISEGRAELGLTHFTVLEVVIDTIEWFQTTTSMQCRAAMHASSNWRVQPLTP